MNDTLALDVSALRASGALRFVAEVREHLGDLDPETREELTDGLAADLSEQVAEQGPAVLEDPASYAAELRAAAGLPAEVTRRRRLGRVRAAGAGQQWRDRVDAALRTPTGAATASFLASIRPAWWVLRAWIGLQLVDVLVGPWEYLSLLPSLGNPVVSLAALVAAVVLSVQIGRGRWPGARSVRPGVRTWSRRGILAANTLGVLVALPYVLGSALSSDQLHDVATYGTVYGPGAYDVSREGLWLGDEEVRQVFAYAADGTPLVGVQLVDQAGRPLDVVATRVRGDGDGRFISSGWRNGEVVQRNVFPLPVRQVERRGFGSRRELGPVQVPGAPYAQLSPVQVDGIAPSTVLGPDEVAVDAAELAALQEAVASGRADAREQREGPARGQEQGRGASRG
ncbi:hypothetical protein KLP28_00825 [Nocardioidaceae bacterium]|nr:hypothetical protein KLP28_00825 [Nocardioidaceae bacterium]